MSSAIGIKEIIFGICPPFSLFPYCVSNELFTIYKILFMIIHSVIFNSSKFQKAPPNAENSIGCTLFLTALKARGLTK